MHLRAATVEDAGLLAGLHKASFAENWTAEALKDLLLQPGVLAVLAEISGDPVGFVLVRVAADEAEILTLAVSPEFRRRGLGRALMAAAAEKAAGAGALALFLEVAADNAAARHLYERLGFAEVGRRSAYYARAGAAPGDALTLKLLL